MDDKLNWTERKLLLGIAALFAVLMIALFGVIGIKVFLTVTVFYMLPIYYVLLSFDITKIERLFFSFFLGISIYPTLVYYISFLVGIRKAMIVVFVLLLIVGWWLRRKKVED